MKKLLFILSAIFVSVMGWGQLNPYAYGLSSAWNATTQTLTVNFKLNAKTSKKIIIYAVDPNNKNTKYKIHEIASPGEKLDFSENIHIIGKLWESNTCLPVNKDLTFAVEVSGERTTPGTPIYTAKRPYSPHGVAVNNCQDSQDFGAVYVTEAAKDADLSDNWAWLKGKGKSLMKYTPRLTHEKSYPKSSAFTDRQRHYLEPHRVVVSDDGRIFVSSYNTNTTGQPAVWEFDPQEGTYTTIVEHNATYGSRVVAIDVKGSGNNIQMLVCYYYKPTSGTGYGWYVVEYSVGAKGKLASVGGIKCQYFPSQDYYKNTLNNAYNNGYYTYTDGFFDVAYGAKKETTVYMGLDYYINFKDGSMNANRTALIYFNADLGTNNMYQYYNCDGHVAGESWGGAGLVTYLDHNGNERIASGRCQNGDRSESDGRIQVYSLNASNVPSTKAYDPITTNTRSVINDLAIDCAYNLYAVSFTDGTTATGSGTLLAVPMPYSGTVTTYCPSSNANANKYFRLPDRTTLHMNDTDEDELNRIVGNNSPVCDCDISLYRPMQADMFNTICLPFDLDLGTLSDGHPLKGAELKAFTGATLSDADSGEKILTLNFEDVNSNTLTAYTPYLIEPKADISGAINIDNITFVASGTTTVTQPITNVNNNSITFKGIVPSQTVTPKEVDGKSLTMMLVSDNRLAMMTEEGTMPGFRGYFEFATTPPQGMQARISTSKNTTTETEVVIDGQKVNVEKFLREGRVYIRMGESLYTLSGEKVE